MTVRPSTKSFFEFNEMWHIGRSRSVMHDPIQSQGQGHEPFKVGNPTFFNRYFLCHLQWELVTDHGFINYGTISKFYREPDLICFSYRVDRQSRTGLIFNFEAHG